MKRWLKKTAPAKHASGFTLVEMIVAVFIFTVVMLIAVAALVSVLDANRRAQATKSVMNNLHFALESMTREIRTGTNYAAATPEQFSFTDKDDCDITYALDDTDGDGNDEIVRTVSAMSIECPKQSTSNVPVTATEVVVETLGFYVSGVEINDETQPNVKIILRGVAGNTQRTRVPFDLQTFITQRFLDR